MAGVSEDFLIKAIHSEVIARDTYKNIADKIKDAEGKKVMLDMSEEEKKNRKEEIMV